MYFLLKIYIKKSFVDVDGPFYVYKMMEIHHKKAFGEIIHICFKFSKNLNKVCDDLEY
jgi:hypothetical protein